MIPIYQIVFYVFAVTLILAALMVVCSRNPVHSILFLVLCFFLSAVLWMLLQAEFLALVLIFVYVGAVMTLFLFVVMMLNIDMKHLKEKFTRYLLWGGAVMVLFSILVVMVVIRADAIDRLYRVPQLPQFYNNTQVMGTLMFTKYVFAFEVAAAILLVAMISSIALVFRGRKNRLGQSVREQHQVTKADRLRIIKNMKGGQS
ncbi:MAG: NADH-quinone oxidoreductase subunit J [Gammaproteobacteria bacterium]|nr:NADH-quinone oxidoreductase subunit J [Gammaproteobacteria bacterium]